MAVNRISQHYKDKKNNKIGKTLFKPDLEEWKKACYTYCYDYQIFKHFDVCKETFYRLLDRERYEKEQGRPSEYLDAYKNGKNSSRMESIEILKKCARKSDEPASVIFYAKTFGGLIESKDSQLLLMKRKELMLKHKEFIAKIAERYQLDFDELKAFADKFFEGAKVDEL